ncbi:MAG: copper homeostasis protein CutC [Bacteroidetes bacterium]|nr:MAG: copper homeostasis protein CutC [Bacteroidota bacterium]
MQQPKLLEVACFSLTGVIAAAAAGANRIELCQNPHAGGTTPSYGLLKGARHATTLPIFPIIRPREGDFLYTDAEFDMMKAEVLLCKSMQFEGLVLGLLLPNGDIDTHRTGKLVDLAYPMEVTFHRAFDRCRNPLSAIQELVALGCSRVLTSGQKPTAYAGMALIKQLVELVGDQLVVMPGGGINANQILELMAATGANEYHGAFRKTVLSKMAFDIPELDEPLTYTSVNADEIKLMLQHLNNHQPANLS